MKIISRYLDPYVMLMLLTVGLASLWPAQGRGIAIAGTAANAGIVFLFFLYGTRLSPRSALDGLLQWRLHIAVLLCTFALFPLLGLGLQAVAGGYLPAALATGIVFLCVMPSTVQSSIAFTSIARGNIPAAICAASASNMLGVVISPLLAGWLLQAHGVALSFGVFRDIFLQLLAPFIVGQLVRPWVGGWIQRHKLILGWADRGSILLIIYVAFSRGMRDGIWTKTSLADLAILGALLVALLAAVLLITNVLGRRVMHLDRADAIVLQFCGSKKSLASGLPMATILFPGPQLGLIVLPLMLFHQIQLIACAILAREYGARAEEKPEQARAERLRQEAA